MIRPQTVNILRSASLLFVVSVVSLKVDAGNDTLQVPDNVSCACPGDVLTYTCNIAGGGTTLWRGSAFDCSSTSNEIRLRHSQFSLSSGTSGTCNNEAMRARSIGLVNTDCYISELDVTARPNFNDRTIECAYNSGSEERTIGTSTLSIVSAPEPPEVQFDDLQDGQIVLRWTPVEPTTCVPTYYRVSSNCSTCSSGTINSTTDSCSLPQQWTDGLVCDFSVQGEVCGNLIGMLSTPILVTLQEPTVTIIPHYSEKDNTLIKFTVLGTNLAIAKSEDMNVFITEYNVTFSDPNTGSMRFYSAPFSTCGEDICETDITPPSLTGVCPSSNITVTADYGFGPRLLSDPVIIGCTNQYVDVQYNSADSTISCVFINQMDTSIKSCRVTYGPCRQEQTESDQGFGSTGLPNNITLSIMPRGSNCYMYTVTASSDNFTVAVEGSLMIQSADSEGPNVGAIIGGVVGASLVIILLVVVLIIVVIVVKMNGQKKKFKPRGTLPMNIIPSLEVKLNLEPVVGRNFIMLEIKNDCKLRKAIEYDFKFMFKRGHAYYEFIHEKENISEDKELILVNKETGEYFYPKVGLDVLYNNHLIGEGVRRPGSQYKKYKVFVQSTGSGARHLPAGSLLLYEKVQTNPWNPEKAPVQQVISNHFMTTTIAKECTVEEFQRDNDLKLKGANVFIEYDDAIKNDMRDFSDVMLEVKKTGQFFTGPPARSNPSDYLGKYRVFVLPREIEKLKLTAGVIILHQNPGSRQISQFHKLEVDKDNVQMAKFVEEKLNVKFENGRAFYEFTQMEEDLLFYRDVVLMSKNKDEFTSSIRRFYLLSKSVLGVGIKPPNLDQYRVFVQSMSQGSRCLKARTLVLYKM